MTILATGSAGPVLLPLLLKRGRGRAGTACGLFVADRDLRAACRQGVAQLPDRKIAA